MQKELIGPHQLLKSGKLDLNAGTITLPLYKGQLPGGESVWYVLTDTTDEKNAKALGSNFASKLVCADVGRNVRKASQQLIAGRTVVVFENGKVDFAPVRSVTQGAALNFFPPTAVEPGSVGDANYSPLAKIGNYIYNAPMVAFNSSEAMLNAMCSGNADHSVVHDKVVALCPRDNEMTLSLTTGFSFARPVLCLSLEANNALPATMEGATHAQAMTDIKVGSAFSAVERLFAIANGPVNTQANVRNPQRQGFNKALKGETGGPLSVLGGTPTIATDYSPLWVVNCRRVDAARDQFALPRPRARRVTDPRPRARRLDDRPRRQGLRLERTDRVIARSSTLPVTHLRSAQEQPHRRFTMRHQFIFTVLATSVLVACGGGGDNADTPPAAAASAPAVAGISPGSAMGAPDQRHLRDQQPDTDRRDPAGVRFHRCDVPATYFGTAPSTVQKEMIGPFQLLKSCTVDIEGGTITLPLYKGQLASGKAVWYVLSDTTDEKNAAALGFNFSGKLVYADVGRGVRAASQQLIGGKTVVVFAKGRVDFTPVHSITPGAEHNYFPPTAFQPGSVGDADYSPLAKIGNPIYNAPMVAFGTSEATLNAMCDGNADHNVVHDKVVSICPRDGVVKLQWQPASASRGRCSN